MLLKIPKWSYKKGQKNSQNGLIIRDRGSNVYFRKHVYF